MVDNDNEKGFEEVDVAPIGEGDMPALRNGNNFPRIFDIFVILGLFLFSQLLVSFLTISFGINLPELVGVDEFDVEHFIGVQVARGESFAMIYPASMLVAFLSIVFYVRYRDGEWQTVRFSRKGLNPNIVLGGLVWLISSQIVLEPLMELLPELPQQGVGRGFWAIMVAIVFAPFFEEIIFRGVIFESLRRRWGKFMSVSLSAFLFALVHFELSVSISALIAGLIFGIVRLRTDSVLPTIVLHSINNAFAFALITFGLTEFSFHDLFVDGVAYSVFYAISLAVFVAVSVDFCRSAFRRRKGVVETVE